MWYTSDRLKFALVPQATFNTCHILDFQSSCDGWYGFRFMLAIDLLNECNGVTKWHSQ